MILRRSFALYGVNTTEGYAGTIQFVVAAHGPGTQWLVQRKAGEALDLVGPLGTPFSLPAAPAPAVLIGGGYGAAPLLPLADALQKQGSEVQIVLGAASADRLFGELAAKRLVGQVSVQGFLTRHSTEGRVFPIPTMYMEARHLDPVPDAWKGQLLLS